MVKHQPPACRKQAGFTLVELAIVMIIIGLLIAGVLKGQALINNAQVTATVAQIKAIDAATTTFKDQYSGFPGDIVSASTKLPNCIGPCASIAGDGNGHLNNLPGDSPKSTEGEAAWSELSAASLVTGITPNAAGESIGANYPATKISNNGFTMGYTNGAKISDLALNLAPTAIDSGAYVATTTDVTKAASVGLTPVQANAIDSKIDDGDPNTGSVQGFGTAGSCDTKATPDAYNTSLTGQVCGLYARVQN